MKKSISILLVLFAFSCSKEEIKTNNVYSGNSLKFKVNSYSEVGSKYHSKLRGDKFGSALVVSHYVNDTTTVGHTMFNKQGVYTCEVKLTRYDKKKNYLSESIVDVYTKGSFKITNILLPNGKPTINWSSSAKFTSSKSDNFIEIIDMPTVVD